jgi:hypothetical protein
MYQKCMAPASDSPCSPACLKYLTGHSTPEAVMICAIEARQMDRKLKKLKRA